MIVSEITHTYLPISPSWFLSTEHHIDAIAVNRITPTSENISWRRVHVVVDTCAVDAADDAVFLRQNLLFIHVHWVDWTVSTRSKPPLVRYFSQCLYQYEPLIPSTVCLSSLVFGLFPSLLYMYVPNPIDISWRQFTIQSIQVTKM